MACRVRKILTHVRFFQFSWSSKTPSISSPFLDGNTRALLPEIILAAEKDMEWQDYIACSVRSKDARKVG
jgi:hypothetical protein